MISYHFPNLEPLGWVLIGIGIVSLILGFTWHYIVRYAKWLKLKIVLVLRVTTRIKEANKCLTIIDDQKKNPTKWLYPVIEYIDLNRRGSIKVDAVVKFQIDSHLLFPINEFYVFLKLCLYDTATYQETDSEDWHEIKQPEHYAPIGKLERRGFGSVLLNFREDTLLKMMEKFRNGEKIHAMLKIGVALKEEDKNYPITLEGSRWIAPMNDYRGV